MGHEINGLVRLGERLNSLGRLDWGQTVFLLSRLNWKHTFCPIMTSNNHTPSPASNIYILNCAFVRVSIVAESCDYLCRFVIFLDTSCLFRLHGAFFLIVSAGVDDKPTFGHEVGPLDGCERWRVRVHERAASWGFNAESASGPVRRKKIPIMRTERD